ncbi:MAG: hypothetical protein OEZ36_04225 [Spirochaetota bacterium]|nr:hypothetical protein [Spirochaetota bacterium]
MANRYEIFSSRMGYNLSLRHFKKVNSFLSRLGDENLADLVNHSESAGELVKDQIMPMVHALLAEKYGYYYMSRNLRVEYSDFRSLVKELKGWHNVDAVLSYHHEHLGDMIMNPKVLSHFDRVKRLEKHELVVVYIKLYEPGPEENPQKQAAENIFRLLDGQAIEIPSYFRKSPASKGVIESRSLPQKASQPTVQVKSTPRQSSPRYSVQISNDLLHEGNVESLKTIIESYEESFPGSKVSIYHNEEELVSFDSLFRSASLIHGDVLDFVVTGKTISKLSKLKRYLELCVSPEYSRIPRQTGSQTLTLF